MMRPARRRVLIAPAYDPAVLSLTGWWRGSYTASPWVGTASAGNSGGGTHNMARISNPASSGTAVNGFNPATFNGSNQQLDNASALSAFITDTAYFYWCLFKATATTGTSGTSLAYNNEQLIGDVNGKFGCSIATVAGVDKVVPWHYDATGSKGDPHAISLSAWNLICVRYDGTNIRGKLNSASVATAAAGTVDDVTGTMMMGASFSTPKFTGSILDMGVMASAGTDALFDDIKAYINSRYGLAL